MNSRIEKLSALVLKYDKGLQSENERLVGLVAAQIRNLDALTGTFPKLKDEIKADVAALDKKLVEASEANTAKIAELAANVSAETKQIREDMDYDKEQAQAQTSELVANLAKQTTTAIEKLDAETRVRAEFVARAIAELAEKGGTEWLLEVYKGEYKGGKQAKRGELWTYYGTTFICVADTTKEPGVANKRNNSWAVFAASGAPGPAGAGGSGSGSSAWGGITGTLADQTDLQAALDALLTIPAQSKSADYTAVLGDAGKSIDHPSTDANARTFTIPANASVAYPVGTCLSFSNMTSNVVTIAITSDTMYLAGTGTTGSRSLAQYGVATARKLTSTTWLISGTGLT